MRVLTADGAEVTAAALDALLNPPRLTGLGLSGCRLSAAAVRVLAGLPGLARLEWLDLSRNPNLRGDALLPLAESGFLSPRCELDVRGCGADDETRAVLADRLGRRLSG